MLIEKLKSAAQLGSAWVLYLMLALSFVSVSVMLERVLFFLRHRDDVEALGKDLEKLLHQGDVAAVKKRLAASPSLEAEALRTAVDWADAGPDAVWEVIESELGRVRRKLERGSTYLGTLGNNAPFVGLLGTVIGVIQAFQMLGEGGQNKAAMGGVMAGIAEALVATGVGLVVALPAVVAYNLVQKRSNDIEANVGILARLVMAHLKSDRSPLVLAAKALMAEADAERSATPLPVAISRASDERAPTSELGALPLGVDAGFDA